MSTTAIQEDLPGRLGTGGVAAGKAGPVVAELRQRGRTILTAAQADGVGGGLPHKHLEEWRQTDISALLAQHFVPGLAAETPAAVALRDQFTLGAQASAEIVLLNGVFAPGLSRLGTSTPGVRVFAVSQGLNADDQAAVTEHLGRYATLDSNPERGFVALNSAGMRDVVVICLSPRASLAKPVHVLLLTTASNQQRGSPTLVASHPRILVWAQPGAQGSLLETFAGPEEAVYLTNAVTEIVLDQDARLEYCRIQQEGLAAFHIATIEAHLSRGATLVSEAATLGAALSRVDLNVRLAGPHAEATLNGLVLIGSSQHADNHTLLDHAVPECVSHELYKHVLSARASGVFKGKILVRPGAQKTDAKQTSKTLLLSEDALIDSQPALEIYADDVKCTHGTTTGPVDEDMIFYLRSRGIAEDAARHLLTYAFAADITRRIKVEPVRQRLETIMAQQHDLPLDLRISGTGAE